VSFRFQLPHGVGDLGESLFGIDVVGALLQQLLPRPAQALAGDVIYLDEDLGREIFVKGMDENGVTDAAEQESIPLFTALEGALGTRALRNVNGDERDASAGIPEADRG
jgi:hypothetical protein